MDEFSIPGEHVGCYGLDPVLGPKVDLRFTPGSETKGDIYLISAERLNILLATNNAAPDGAF
ncbi:hypothetical protein AJ80_01007 [Polytolypa hystricis UAMH7299]|uniref:Uncharacterized protein n=1 Tax=Polytolypa hystricis (strain UAMH7299) TaxID=1447883 RepID=A0A2B7Z391_POLH7|nr:hypothetical protein AJ80_01007 [Polytolypa hystricis UAMH7299]